MRRPHTPMAKKKARKVRTKKNSSTVAPKEKPAEAHLPSDLSESEQDLVWHMEHGYKLETDSLGGNPVLRNLKNDEVLRPVSANRSTVEALEKRGLIFQGKTSDPLKIVWRMRKDKK
jgi:hypothetical protein